LKGHERSITQIIYNREGDLLFSASKAPIPTVWNSDTGERIGTYRSHTGAVYSLDVSRNSTLLLTGSADTTVKLWDVNTGNEIFTWRHKAPVRWVNFAYGDRKFLVVTDGVMGKAPTIFIYLCGDQMKETPVKEIVGPSLGSKISQAQWGPLNKTIFSTSEDGTVTVWDPETGKSFNQIKDSLKAITRMAFSRDQTHFITASLDHAVRLYDTKTLKLLKTYDTGRPVNAISLSPILPHILVGGGQAAESVTTTRMDSSQFKVRFFHKIFEEELASLPGHFGPVNTLAFCPDGRSFASGGEDGFIRIHHLDDSYLRLGEDDDDFEEETFGISATTD